MGAVRVTAPILLLLGLALTVPSAAGAKPAHVIVDYVRTGGFIGVQDHLVVRADGHGAARSRGGRRRVFHLSHRRLVALRAALTRAHLPRHATYQRGGAADVFLYAIRTPGHLVYADEIAAPKRITALVAVLERLRASG
jgi:hypothetical protein